VQLENTLKIATTNKLIDAIGLELGQILCTYVASLGICGVQELWTMVLWCNFGQKNEGLLFAIFVYLVSLGQEERHIFNVCCTLTKLAAINES